MFKYSLDNKRYHTLNYYFKNKYGKKTFKVSLNGNFSCPNKINGKGCIFCSRLGSGDFAGDKNKDLITQFNEIKTIMENKWPNSYYIGYFQANTNTFAPIDELKEKYEAILNLPNVIGLNIATRSDAISKECYDYLEELNKKTNLIVELGLQSIHKKTLNFINRGHDLTNFEKAVKELQKRNIETVVHIINGLPGETKEDMIETVKYLNKLNINGIKIHMLHIIEDTDLNDYYKENPFHILTKEEYIDIVIEQLENLKPEIVIHRITGDPKKEDLVEPTWLLKKFCVLNDIDKEMAKRNTFQGKKTQ
ncbi:MAG: TIGR01212 family radical SAM protein [Bacilli bacterium]|nr:TIGR01212 family radical SAM protein [Bacilli bacterium]